MKLNPNGLKVLETLVKELDKIDPHNQATYPSYGHILNLLGIYDYVHAGKDLEARGLKNLGDWAHYKKVPAITGMIIDNQSGYPGDGFYKLYGIDMHATNFIEWWQNEILEAKSFDWSEYLPSNTQTSVYPKTPVPDDARKYPEKIKSQTFRILRDTKLAKRVKKIHNYQCQLCETSISIPTGRYAEAHHLMPVGSPHNGPDSFDNLICVCPNHHVELDYFSRPLSLQNLRQLPEHKISIEFIQYHNKQYEKAKL